jgi:hypothetical protein
MYSIEQTNNNELSQLQIKYDRLIQQYTTIQNNIANSTLSNLNRLNSTNPYLNKHLQFTDGTIIYVTNQGVARLYTSKDIFEYNVGRNGCPTNDLIKLNIPWSSEYIKGATIHLNPKLIVGSNMTKGESCGNEGLNVFASKLINNPKTDFVGCYNDNPASTDVNIVPVMNKSNNVNGFKCSSSSIYSNNNDAVGPWSAFDQNSNTFWHSDTNSSTKYNSNTGIYEGNNGINIVNIGKINGEYIQIDMPISNAIKQYTLSPRLDLITTRSPNSWYIIGYKDNLWYQVDRQVNQIFTNSVPKQYNIYKPKSYSSYILLVDKVGNSDQTNNRTCVQIAEWNLYMNSVSNDTRAMILNQNLLGYTSFDKCQEYAVENGYSLFGLQDYQSNGTASCLVSNDIVRTKLYGDATTQSTLIPIWSSNTSGQGATCIVSSDGKLIINETSNNNILWQSSNAPSSCLFGGKVNSETIQGSFGGNCVGKPLNIDCGNPDKNKSYGPEGIIGNLNKILKNMVLNTNESNWSFNPMNDFKEKDPAVCCAKKIDYTYQCGGGPFKKGQISGGSNINFDCSKEVNYCTFILLLQSDGNLCLFRGTPEKMEENIWCTNTTGLQKSPNQEWISKKGKYGRNYIKLNEGLGPGDWIGSEDGSFKLIMQQDGNLVLYTSETSSGCKTLNGKTYGNKNINAVYQINETGDKSTLGNIGYIDSESNLREYPKSMVGFTNNYQIYQNTDIIGNDLKSAIASNQKDCELLCNENSECGAFVFQGSSQTCWLKNASTFDKRPNNNVVSGIRQPGLKSSVKCNNKIVNIDTIQYNNYTKGLDMINEEKCSNTVISHEDKLVLDNIKSQLITLGNDIVAKIEELQNEETKVLNKIDAKNNKFNKDLEKYKELNIKIKKELKLQHNIEGMQNYDRLNINDLNGMLSDSELSVLQENYKYMLWSIFAIGILTVTINVIKK